MNTDHAVHAIPPFYASKFMDRNVLSIPVNRTVALFHPNKIAEQIYAEAKPMALEMGVVLVIPSPLSCDSCVSSCFQEKSAQQ